MDALAQPEKTKRRWRNRRHPTARFVSPTDRDVHGILRPVYDYPHLPEPFITEFAKPYTKGKTGVGMRITDLFHETNTEHGGPYLDRIDEHASMPAFARPAFYDTTPYAEQALAEHGYPTVQHTHYEKFNPHAFMGSCRGASIELAARDDPSLTFESRNLILSQAPNQTMSIACDVRYRGELVKGFLRADDIFGLGYNDEYWRLFFCEDDRNSEPANFKNHLRSSYELKILRYQKVIGEGLYKDHFGRKCGALVLNLTTNEKHMQTLIETVLDMTDGKGLSYMLFKTAPSFGKNLTVPPVMRELLTTPWHRAGYPSINISKPN